jgi:sn-glycerol 3-phosphate transport system permease protein
MLRVFFPLISPTTFFLTVVNLVCAFFETFAITRGVTSGGRAPPRSRSMRCTGDGECLDLGGSSVQSVILMLIVIALTVPQFRPLDAACSTNGRCELAHQERASGRIGSRKAELSN